MAWFRYLKSDETISSSSVNTNYSYPFCKRFISRFIPRDTLSAGEWIFVNISNININKYKDINLTDTSDDTSYLTVYEKGNKIGRAHV